jgi:hypothetical protein
MKSVCVSENDSTFPLHEIFYEMLLTRAWNFLSPLKVISMFILAIFEIKKNNNSRINCHNSQRKTVKTPLKIKKKRKKRKRKFLPT